MEYEWKWDGLCVSQIILLIISDFPRFTFVYLSLFVVKGLRESGRNEIRTDILSLGGWKPGFLLAVYFLY